MCESTSTIRNPRSDTSDIHKIGSLIFKNEQFNGVCASDNDNTNSETEYFPLRPLEMTKFRQSVKPAYKK